MCTENQLHIILDRVAKDAESFLGGALDAVVLYGSYARGDYDSESDIDIMIRINCDPADLTLYEDHFALLCSRLSMEYDITVSIVTVSAPLFEKYKNALPFYSNADKEGIHVA